MTSRLKWRPRKREILGGPSEDTDKTNMCVQRKGDYLTVKIDDYLVLQEANQLQNSLIGILTLAQGDKPYSFNDLRDKLGQIWGLGGSWNLVPRGRGYYNIQLPSLADRDRILNKQSWGLRPGVIHLQRWVRGFNSYKANSSLAQVWVRFYEIPMEYFHPKIIQTMASALGTVLKLDERTRNRSMCHYARVLIDIDMKKGCEDCIMFELDGQVLFSSLKYKQMPLFCNNCGIVGHVFGTCRTITGQKLREDREAGKASGLSGKHTTRVDGGAWVQKDIVPTSEKVIKDPITALENQNAFAALKGLEEGEMLAKETHGENSMASNTNDANMVDVSSSANNDNSTRNEVGVGQVVASSKKGQNCGFISKEYNLHNKAVVSHSVRSSPPTEQNFVLGCQEDSVAMKSMRAVASKSWADMCEDDLNPPKHGSDRVSR